MSASPSPSDEVDPAKFPQDLYTGAKFPAIGVGHVWFRSLPGEQIAKPSKAPFPWVTAY